MKNPEWPISLKPLILANFTNILFCCVSFVLLCGCSKHFDEEKQVQFPPTPEDNPVGTLYINVVGDFIKVDVASDSEYWRSSTLFLFNSYRNPMTFDSNYFYHGNYMSMSCYNAATGQPVWTYSWLAFEDAISYQEPVFSGNQIFFTAPTSAWDHGYLYCKDKRTGTDLWQQQIDSGGVFTSFNGIPVLYGNKVITLTRDYNNNKRLKAYSITSGELVWSVPVSNSMSSKLWISDSKIYSAYGQEAICIDAENGQLLWQTDLNITDAWTTYNFFENDHMIVVKVLDNTHYKVFQLQKSNGAISDKKEVVIPSTYAQFDQQLAPLGCNYTGKQLFFTSYYSIDSLDITCMNVSNSAVKWKKRISNNLLTQQAPIITDKYIILPVNQHYNTPLQEHSEVLFLNLEGDVVKKVPFRSIYTDGFVYKENGTVYKQSTGFK